MHVAATGHEVDDVGAQLREGRVLNGVCRLGEERRIRHAGCDVRIDKPAGTLVVNHEVHAGQVAQTQRRMGLDGCCLQVSEQLVGEACRHEVLGLVGGVASVVVVAAAIRRHLDRRKGHGTIPQIDDGNGHIAAVDALLDHQALAVSKGIHHRAAQCLGVLSGRNTECGATVRRLNDDGEGHRTLKSREYVRGSQLAENRLRKRHPAGRCEARRAQQSLRSGLVRGEHRLHRRRAHEGDSDRLQERLQGAVLADRAVHQRPHDIGREGLNSLRERRVNVGNTHLVAELGQDICDATARTNRDVTLVRQTASDDQNFGSHGGVSSGNC